MAKPGTSRVEKHLRSVFPDGVISRVQVLEYGDDPAVEPGDVAVRVFLARPDRPEGEEADEDVVGSFEKANRERFKTGCVRSMNSKPGSERSRLTRRGPVTPSDNCHSGSGSARAADSASQR